MRQKIRFGNKGMAVASADKVEHLKRLCVWCLMKNDFTKTPMGSVAALEPTDKGDAEGSTIRVALDEVVQHTTYQSCLRHYQ
jgi:hypothetical protein